MYRFIAMIWSAPDERQSDAAEIVKQRLLASQTDWSCVVKSPGLWVYHSGAQSNQNQAYVVEGEQGAVLGKLFDRQIDNHSAPSRVIFDSKESRNIIQSEARRLVEYYWGRYVAFIKDRRSDISYALRAPTGALPCYYSEFRGVDIYFSDPEYFSQLDLMQFSINWDYIAKYLSYRALQINDTGLNEVTEVQPGECIRRIGDTTTKTAYWDPARIANTDVIENPERAIVALRHATKSCVNAWASCYPSIIHTLSGGLDSSIVLSCLSKAPTRPAITCLNYFSADAEGDERALARLAAQRAQCELVERTRASASIRFEPLLNIAKSARPTPYRYQLEHSLFEAELAREIQAEAVFTGGGGDALFYQARVGLGAADYVRLHGLRRRLFMIALDAARVEKISVWSMLSKAIGSGLLARSSTGEATAVSEKRTLLVAADVLSSVDRKEIVHPYLKAAAGLPPGKLFQIHSCAIPTPYYDILVPAGGPEHVHPLVSQPLIEVCLRIPTYILTIGGQDRAIARRAFAQDVPTEIITRHAKGGLVDHVKIVFHNNIAFIREFLLDGLLVNRRLLDRHRLEQLLSEQHAIMNREFSEIQDHISTEAWLRSWSNAEQKAAA